MANIIKPKRSNTAAKVPNTTELTSGELGVNMADRKVYINNGTAVVQVGAGNLSGLGDVAVSSPTNGQSLSYNSTTSKWVNSSAGTGTVTSVGITAGTGVTVSNSPITTSGNIAVGLSTKLTAIENLSGAGFITQNGSGVIAGRTLQAGTGISIAHGNGSSQDPIITNSAPDQTVALTGAGATSISGTYPNFTITSTNTTYSLATSTVLGLIELGSDTQQTVAPNAVSATASRSYALQVNAAGQGVVNVPWTDTNSGGTVTSVSGTGTASGLSLSGTVTTSGNLTLGGTLAVTPSNFASQTANTVLAAPNGAAGVPTFRAIVAADIPTLNQSTTGNAATATTATTATNVTVTTSGTASAFKVPFVNTTTNTTGNYGLLHDSQSTFTYNPSTNTLTADVVVAANNFSTGGSANGRYFARNSSNVQVLDFGVGAGTGTTNDIGLINLLSGSIVFGTNSGEKGRIDTNGYFVLGSNFASYNYNGNSLNWLSNAGGLALSNASTGDANQIVFNNPNGQVGFVNTVGTTTIYSTASDYRLKKDIEPMVGALQKIAMLKPCTYKWKIDDSVGQGFIAHELQEVIPNCVVGEKDATRDDGTPKYQGVDTSFLVATLTAAIQEQQAIIQDLKARIEALEAPKI